MITSFRPPRWSRGVVLGLTVALAACGGDSDDHYVSEDTPHYRATIERTTYGVPHITAGSYGGAGYGHGYAIAEDNLCTLADAFVTFRGERSKYFGGDGQAAIMGTFGTPQNLAADFFFRFVVDDERVAAFRDAQPANIRDLSKGFAAGFSRYVREIQAGEHDGRHQACRDADWLATISEGDVYRRLVALNLAASSANLLPAIASAQPPGAALTLRTAGDDAVALNPDRFKVGQEAGIGSNTLAFGADVTDTGRSLLFANPHWYQLGVDRFYQLQLTIPGRLNVSGVSIMGAPMVLMGFNDNIAWAHTVSTASRFTVYALALSPEDPTVYIKDGEPHAMTAVTVEVPVKQGDGSLQTVSRTLYESEYGPMINPAVLNPAVSWNTTQAFTLRDINLENTRSFQNFFAFDHAESLEDFYDAITEFVGIPWVNTTAIGRDDDRALYSDITAVPNVPDAVLQGCAVPGFSAPLLEAGVVLLGGTNSVCDWQNDPDNRQPGSFGPDNLPHLFRRDYVANMNDSYWLTNADNPITGFARIIGQEDYRQSLRSRLGHTLVEDRFAGADGLAGSKVSSENLRQIVVNSRNLSAELLKDEVLSAVCGAPSGDEAQACQVLTAWDNRANLDSVGAHIWTALFEGGDDYDGLRDIENLWATPFDAEDPVHTPRGLNSAVTGQVQTAFSAAVAAVVESGVALDAEVGDYQKYLKPGTDISQFGGEGSEGYFTVLRNTYMHVVDFPEGEPVRAFTFLTNGLSDDPASPYYGSYTQAYSQKNWHRVPFTREQIEDARISTLELSE